MKSEELWVAFKKSVEEGNPITSFTLAARLADSISGGGVKPDDLVDPSFDTWLALNPDVLVSSEAKVVNSLHRDLRRLSDHLLVHEDAAEGISVLVPRSKRA